MHKLLMHILKSSHVISAIIFSKCLTFATSIANCRMRIFDSKQKSIKQNNFLMNIKQYLLDNRIKSATRNIDNEYDENSFYDL